MIIVSLTDAGHELTVDSAYSKAVTGHFSQFANHETIEPVNIKSRKADWYSAYEFRENASVYCFDNDLIVRCRPYSHAWGRQANLFARNVGLVADFAKRASSGSFSRHMVVSMLLKNRHGKSE